MANETFPMNRLGLHRSAPQCSPGWVLELTAAPTPLIGANGMRRGPDKRLYVAQAFGSQISAVDLATGEVDVVIPVDGPVTSPDDVAFDSVGNLYVTDIMTDEVSMIQPNGQVDVLASDLPVVNGLTIVRDRVFVNEYRPGGRLLEVFRDGRTPKILAEGLASPNAFAVGPDDHLYFPAVAAGEIWRIPIDGGATTRVVGGLSLPTSVKIDGYGRLFVTCAGDGTVRTIDLRGENMAILARVARGIDNIEFGDEDSIYISHFTDGAITHLDSSGAAKVVVPGGMLGPFGLACTGSGDVIVADGVSLAILAKSGGPMRPTLITDEGAPPFIRAIAVDDGGTMYLTSPVGTLVRYRFGGSAEILASGLQQPMGVAVANGEIIFCEQGSGKIVGLVPDRGMRVIASGLRSPTGICVEADGTILVSDATAGQVVAIDSGGAMSVLVTNLIEPQGIALHGRHLYVFDKGAGAVLQIDLQTGTVQPIATGLATDHAIAGQRNVLPGIVEAMEGPLTPFAGLAACNDGSLYISCEAEGSIWKLAPSSY